MNSQHTSGKSAATSFSIAKNGKTWAYAKRLLEQMIDQLQKQRESLRKVLASP